MKPLVDGQAQFVVFTLDDFRYGLPLEAVERAVRVVEVTPLPKAPEVVMGVINVGGRVIPVINMRSRLDLSERPMTLNDQLILARTPKRPLALLVDAVVGMVSVSPESLVAADQVVPRTKYVKGLAKLDDGLVLIQDLESFLSLEEERALDDAVRQGEM